MSHGAAPLLGALMLDNDAWPAVAATTRAADFADPRDRLIFEAMAALAVERLPLEVVSVYERLRESGALADAGGVGYLVELVDQAPGAHSALRLAREISEEAQ